MIFLVFFIHIFVFWIQIKLFLRNKAQRQTEQDTRATIYWKLQKQCDDNKKKNENLQGLMTNLESQKKKYQNLYDIFGYLDGDQKSFEEKAVFLKNKIWNLFQCRSVRYIVLENNSLKKIIPQTILDLSLSQRQFFADDLWKEPREEDWSLCDFFSQNGIQDILVFNTLHKEKLFKIGMNSKVSSCVVLPLVFDNNIEAIMVFENIDESDLEIARMFSTQFFFHMDIVLKKSLSGF